MTFLQLIASLGQNSVPANSLDGTGTEGPLSPMMLNPALLVELSEEMTRSSEAVEGLLVTVEGERKKQLTVLSFERFRAEICGDGTAANEDTAEGHDTAMA